MKFILEFDDREEMKQALFAGDAFFLLQDID